MKGFSLTSLLVVICVTLLLCFCVAPPVANAGQPVRVAIPLDTSLGTASWTNAWNLRGAKLVSIEVFNSLNATNTITAKRVRDTSRTNTVCAIACSSSAGIYWSVTNSVFSFWGDVFTFSSMVSTGSSVEATFELSP